MVVDDSTRKWMEEGQNSATQTHMHIYQVKSLAGIIIEMLAQAGIFHFILFTIALVLKSPASDQWKEIHN